MNFERGIPPEVTFGLRHILQLNGRPIDSVDISPKQLEVTLEEIDTALQVKFHELELSAERLRPVILLTRLALYDQPYMALTQNALISGEHFFTHASILTEEALPYWHVTAATKYQPQIHNLRSVSNDTAGVWLGISQR